MSERSELTIERSEPARTGTHLHDLLGPWVPHQRWYPAKGREARLEVIGALEVPTAEDGVRVLIHIGQIVTLEASAVTEVVQVPLVHRTLARTDSAASTSLLGLLTDPSGTAWYVYDGPHDPAYTAGLLSMIAGQVRALGLGLGGEREESAGVAAGRRPPGAQVPAPDSPARVLRGEQSNTSIIVEPPGGPPVIVKVFRTLHPGRNPDVEVQAAMTAAGVRSVPALAGWVEGSWPTAAGDEPVTPKLAHGDLAVASEFLDGAQDAWREAVAAVTSGDDFSDRARGLGAATAAVHQAMAEHLTSRPATEQDAVALAEGLRARARWAIDSAPALAPHAQALTSALAGYSAPDLPPLQRVHGDYHLGQVLLAGDRGWVLLDFEGEPLRPLAERTLPDLALRDVAGMLRSFDYAARQGGSPDSAAQSPSAWLHASREAFLDGYTAAGGDDPRTWAGLLDALELDKALYEVVYETRNRPDWLGVPLGAIERLLAALAG